MITRKRVDDEEDVKARPGKKGYTGPALEAGLVGTQRCVSSRSSHLQVTPLSAPENWKLRSLDIKDAFLEEDGFDREAYLRAPLGQDPTKAGCRLNGGGVPQNPEMLPVAGTGFIDLGRPEVSGLRV